MATTRAFDPSRLGKVVGSSIGEPVTPGGSPYVNSPSTRTWSEGMVVKHTLDGKLHIYTRIVRRKGNTFSWGDWLSIDY